MRYQSAVDSVAYETTSTQHQRYMFRLLQEREILRHAQNYTQAVQG